MRSNIKIFLIDEQGGSVVEIALLSILFFPIICYAAFFYDFSLANLKSLEASRYAAWELTAMKLWDWKKGTFILESGPQNQSMFNTASQTISKEVAARWGDDLNGATSSGGSSTPFLFDSSQEKHSGLAVTTLKETNIVILDGETTFLSEEFTDMGVAGNDGNTSEKPIYGEGQAEGLGDLLGIIIDKISSILDKVAKVAFEWLGFNRQGFAETQFSFTLEFTKTAPLAVPIFSGKLFDRNLFSNKLLPAKQKILVDAWDLKEGVDVDEGFSHHYGSKTDYYHQVGAVYLLGAPRQAGNLEDLIIDNTFGKFLPASVTSEIPGIGEIISLVLGVIGIHNPFNPVVRSYRMKGFNKDGGMLEPKVGNDCYYQTEACIDYDSGPNATKSNNVADPEGANSRRKFYTNVYKDTAKKDDSPYYRVYKQLGGYYMGCGKSQQKRCQ